MKKAYADLPEGQMHYRTEGTGDVIVLLHMAVASSDEYTRVMHFLSKDYCAIALDFLGAGDSDPAPYAYQVFDHAKTVVSFMDSLDIKKASVVGQFNGAMIAGEVAINWPERVDKLVLSGTGFWEESEAKTLNEPPNFTTTVEIKPDGSHLLEWWRRACLWGDYPLEILEERVLEYIKAGPRGEEAHWAGGAYNLKPRLPLIPCPTLVLDAPHYPFHYLAKEVKKLIPNSRLTYIENGPMYLDRAMPKEYAGAILNFLSSPNQVDKIERV
jgi:pimeloyl-ACP methyl ester carboxylesterase